jgi:hypothetical protein
LILDISYYDVYDGIIIIHDCIDVTAGHYPFDMNQKFRRGKEKFKVVDIIWLPHKDRLINRFVFETIPDDINEDPKRFDISAVQVLESIKQGRTKFSL